MVFVFLDSRGARVEKKKSPKPICSPKIAKSVLKFDYRGSALKEGESIDLFLFLASESISESMEKERAGALGGYSQVPVDSSTVEEERNRQSQGLPQGNGPIARIRPAIEVYSCA